MGLTASAIFLNCQVAFELLRTRLQLIFGLPMMAGQKRQSPAATGL